MVSLALRHLVCGEGEYQFGGLGNQVNPGIKLSQLVVASRRVGDDLDA